MHPRRVVLVSGASRGIGRATALAFAERGFAVAVTSRTPSAGARLEHQLRDRAGGVLPGSLETIRGELEALGAEVLALPMDLLDRSGVERVVPAVLERFGALDVLVNNALYQDPAINAPFLALEAAELGRILEGNVTAAVRLTQDALRAMLRAGGGRIINVSSAAGESSPPLGSRRQLWGYGYGAAKAAFGRMAGIVNAEHGSASLRAFNVNPGVVATEALSAAVPEALRARVLAAAASPRRIALAITWLATEPAALELPSGTTIELQDLARRVALDA